ncbi:MAG: helix-turn-helix domain-containing protein [Clostridiales bacterium]|jgi:predicted transcriptional regulator|nr:helix-turn-helix domain-containing protein [Clostridiales bacterium]
MKYYRSLREAFPICDAIGSPVRLELLELIADRRVANLDTLAKSLHLSNGALTKHIAKLEEAGLVRVTRTKGKRGFQKLCSVAQDKLIIDIAANIETDSARSFEIPLGLYSDFTIAGSCGIVSAANYIGARNEKSSFLSAARADAAALWFEKGKLTYMLPPLPKADKISELRFTFEISPDIIGRRPDKTGDVYFRLDSDFLGKAEISAPPSERRGFLTPAWYDSVLPQYGTLKTLRVTRKCTFLDGERISSAALAAARPARLTIGSDSGFMLFGKNFGDYNFGIMYSAEYD